MMGEEQPIFKEFSKNARESNDKYTIVDWFHL